MQVSMFLDDVKKGHVADFNFHIVVHELVDAKKQAINSARSTDDDQMGHNLERRCWAQAPIQLQDILTRRVQKPPGRNEEETRGVLMIGNPGTGLSVLLVH